VIFIVHEMKRLGLGAAKPLTITEDPCRHDIQLEFPTGPSRGCTTRPGAALHYSRSSPAWRVRTRVRPGRFPRRVGILPQARPTRRAPEGDRRQYGRLRPHLARQRHAHSADPLEARHHLWQEPG
jgi:hypothetical protein